MKTAATAKRRLNAKKSVRRVRKNTGAATLYDQFKAFDGRADDLPPDLALQHDHYLYGTAKRSR